MARRDFFSTIRSEGALLPPDFLKRLAEGDRNIAGTDPEFYHLPPREKLSEAITRSWNRLLGYWSAFQAATGPQALPESDPATGLTREKWLLPLFQELGYGRLPAGRGFDIEGQHYPISHAWLNTPIHLLGRNVDLDRVTKGVMGAARRSPHGLVQEFLNRHDGHLWGFLSNGLRLRILRDNKSLTRQAYVEFDLAGMMDGQVYSDFALLWLLCHQSRVEAPRAEQCWLEKWADTAREQGTRALEDLRQGVERAIVALGSGFLQPPANQPLLEKLRTGALDRQDYYRQLLRVVYRLIFLFVAEDRDLLLTAPPGSPQRRRYLAHYSVSRLRTLAERRRGTPHPDLWQALRLVFARLSSPQGCPELGLPALGSFLWSDRATPDLDVAELPNAALLEAVRSLAFTLHAGIRRVIDYRNLGAEELGSVYESLLELHPELDAGASHFELKVAAGHERKTTGSYYTPTSLIECLLDSALDPVLAEAAKAKDAERAILDLKVCDPACGSGHFLIAAAHRIANRLAAVRTGDEEPSPEAVRRALRDVVGRCLYGVDINPMAVELCKVNLWLEALEPGKPLSFLEHHVQCGNSLLGATPALLRAGIPDAAFEPIEGDDRKRASELKKRNKTERTERETDGARQTSLFAAFDEFAGLRTVARRLDHLEQAPDADATAVQAKERAWGEIVASLEYRHARLAADSWCAAFVWPKHDPKTGKPEPYAPTDRLFRNLLRDPEALPAPTKARVEHIASEYGFLHWHLAFPTVFQPEEGSAQDPTEESPRTPGWKGGFDVVLGNPPWDRVKLQEKEFFAALRPDIAAAPNAAARGKLIAALKKEDPSLDAAFRAALRQADGESALMRQSGRYPLCGRGDVNTYAVFAELNRALIAPSARAGFIVPTGIATDDTTRAFFDAVMSGQEVVQLLDFENTATAGFFRGVGHGNIRFSLLTIGRRPTACPEFLFYGHDVAERHDVDRRFQMTAEDVRLVNPNTRTCPIFRGRRDAHLAKAIYRRVPVLIEESKGEAGNPWGIEFRAMLHMSNDSHLFRTAPDLLSEGWVSDRNTFTRTTGAATQRMVPLYEAKMVHQFDHRNGDYRDRAVGVGGVVLPDVPVARKADPHYQPWPRYWVPEEAVGDRLEGRWKQRWLMGWRDISRAVDRRTVIASVVPRYGVGDKFLLLLPREPAACPLILGALNSTVFDYCARQKVGGTSLKFFTMRQLPLLPPSAFASRTPWRTATTLEAPEGATSGDAAFLDTPTVSTWITTRVLELVYTTWDLQPFARDLGYEGPPFVWDSERRFTLRCELDAAFFHLYGIKEDDAAYILDTFPIVRQNDEKQYGGYRTKEQILADFRRLGSSEPRGRA
ncbi:MAG: N-6 DNA methylase [Vicinamibacteria bacterium]|nr:N-6 DNA methylase [Vicinamibacteria bacterium]